MKRILYIDMDGVLADFEKRSLELRPDVPSEYKGEEYKTIGFFESLEPVEGSIEAVSELKKHFDCYILSAVPWSTPTGATEKLRWLKTHFGNTFRRKVFFTHRKDMCIGDFLIDDNNDKNGSGNFKGELIHFGSERFPDWNSVTQYLLTKIEN